MSLFTTARSAVGVVTRHNDINIVFLLVTVIALMIIPLPTPVVDTLIGANMALGWASDEPAHRRLGLAELAGRGVQPSRRAKSSAASRAMPGPNSAAAQSA